MIYWHEWNVSLAFILLLPLVKWSSQRWMKRYNKKKYLKRKKKIKKEKRHVTSKRLKKNVTIFPCHPKKKKKKIYNLILKLLFIYRLLLVVPGGYKAQKKLLMLREKCPYLELFWCAIFPHSDWIRTRITLNTDTFYAVWINLK